MLTEIPIQVDLPVLLAGVGVVAAAVAAGILLAGRKAAKVDPNDILR